MSVRESYGIFYIISVTIMISSFGFTEFSHNIQQTLWNWWAVTSLALPRKSHELATRAQPVMGFAAPW